MKTLLKTSDALRFIQLRRFTRTALNSIRAGIALVFALCLHASANADVAGYFKFDQFIDDTGVFPDDAGKGLTGRLGFPFSTPQSVAGPSGQAGDLAVSFDGNG